MGYGIVRLPERLQNEQGVLDDTLLFDYHGARAQKILSGGLAVGAPCQGSESAPNTLPTQFQYWFGALPHLQ